MSDHPIPTFLEITTNFLVKQNWGDLAALYKKNNTFHAIKEDLKRILNSQEIPIEQLELIWENVKKQIAEKNKIDSLFIQYRPLAGIKLEYRFRFYRIDEKNTIQETINNNIKKYPERVTDFFIAAASCGLLTQVKLLWENNHHAQIAMMLNWDCLAVQLAITNGQLPILEFLWLKADELQVSLSQSGNKHAFCAIAIKQGHLHILEFLWNKISQETKEHIFLENEYADFRIAAENGHLHILKFLWVNASDVQKQKMLKAVNYGAFRNAAERGHLDVLEFLWEVAPSTQKQSMLQAVNYYAFRMANVRAGVDIPYFLWDAAAENEKSTMLEADDFLAFRRAAQFGSIGWFTASKQQNLDILTFIWIKSSTAQKRTLLKKLANRKNDNYLKEVSIEYLQKFIMSIVNVTPNELKQDLERHAESCKPILSPTQQAIETNSLPFSNTFPSLAIINNESASLKNELNQHNNKLASEDEQEPRLLLKQQAVTSNSPTLPNFSAAFVKSDDNYAALISTRNTHEAQVTQEQENDQNPQQDNGPVFLCALL